MSEFQLDYLFLNDPEKAFEVIYREHYQMLCNRSLQITYDRSSAEDVVQEVLLELWNRKEEIKLDTSLLAYISRSVYNRSLNFVKAKAMQFQGEDMLSTTPDRVHSASEQLIGKETDAAIQQAISTLPVKCRTVFALSRYEGKSYKEISEDLGISVKTVENQIGKALRLLRERLTNN